MALPKGFSILQFNDEPDESVNTAAILFNHLCEISQSKSFFEKVSPTTGSSCDYANLCITDYKEPEGYRNKWQIDDACHARARGEFQHLFFNRWYNKDVKVWRGPFIHWLANESPMAGIFLSKNPDMILKYGAIVDARVYKGLAFAAAICTRSLHEHATQACLWYPLVQAGVHPTVAYMIAMCHFDDAGSIFQKSVGHGGVDPYYWDSDAAKRWCGIKPLIEDGKRRMADGTFFDWIAKREDVREAFQAPSEKVSGIFGTIESCKKDYWVQWQADNWQDNLKKLGIEVAQLGTFQTCPPALPKNNLNEPEEDI